MQIVWQNFTKNVHWVVLHQNYILFKLKLTGCHGNSKGWTHFLSSSMVEKAETAELFLALSSALVAMATFKYWLMGKLKMQFIATSLQIFWQNLYKNDPQRDFYVLILCQPLKLLKRLKFKDGKWFWPAPLKWGNQWHKTTWLFFLFWLDD